MGYEPSPCAPSVLPSREDVGPSLGAHDDVTVVWGSIGSTSDAAIADTLPRSFAL